VASGDAGSSSHAGCPGLLPSAPEAGMSSPPLTFVAELAGPAAVTDALPRLVARPVETPWHTYTLLTVLALPAWIAPAGGQSMAAW